MNIKRQDKPRMKIDADIALNYPGRTFRLKEVLEQKSANAYDNSFMFKVDPYEQMSVSSSYVKSSGQHEITTNAKIFSYKPVYLNVKFNEDLKDLKASVDARYDKSEYKADVANKIKNANGEVGVTSLIDVTLPERRYTLNAEVEKTPKEITHNIKAAWKVGAANARVYASSGKIILSKTDPELIWKLVGDKDMKIQLTMDGKYKWLSSERSISGKIKLKSTIPKLEAVIISLSHEKNGQDYVADFKAMWAPRKQISAECKITPRSWSNWKSEMEIKTPFEAFRDASVTSEFELEKGSIEFLSEVEVNKKKSELKLEGKANLDEHLIEGSLVLKTPYPKFEDISLTVSHKDDAKVYNSMARVQWAPRKAIECKLTMNNARNGWNIESSGVFSLTTPFEGYRITKATWNHANTETSINTHEDLNVFGREASLDIKGAIKDESGKKVVDLEANLKTPWEKLKDITIKIGHEHKPGTFEDILTKGSFAYSPSEVIAVTSEAHYIPEVALVKRIKITSPFKGYEVLTMDIDNRVAGKKYMTHKEVKWAPNKKIALDGELTRNSPYEFSSKVRLSTPFDGFERTVLIMNNDKQKKQWVSDIQLDYGKNKVIGAQTKFQWASYKRLGFKVTSPFKSFRSLGIELEHKGKLRQFQSRASLDYDPFGGPVTGVVKVDTVNPNRISGKMTIKSPFKEYNPIRVLVRHTRTARSGYTSYGSVILARKSYTVESGLVGKGLEDFSHKLTATIHPKKEVNVQTKFSMKKGVSGSLDVKTPVDSLKKFGLEFNHDGVLKNFKNDYSIEYNNLKYTGKNEFALEGAKLNAKSVVRTPHQDYKTVSLVVSHDGKWNKFVDDISFTYPKNTYSSHAEFDMDTELPKLAAKLNLKTPIRKMRNINLALSHTGQINNFVSEALFEYPRNTFKANAEFKYNQVGGENIESKFTLSTPYTRPISLEASHKGPSFVDCTTVVKAMYGQKKCELEAVFKDSPNKYTVTATVKTPIDDFEKITLDVTNIHRNNFIKTNVKLSSPRKRYNLEMEMRKNNDNINLGMTVNTPFEGFENVAVDVKKVGDIRNFEADVTYERKEKYAVGVKFDMRKKVSGEIRATIPCIKVVNNVVSFEYAGEPTDFTVTVDAKIMDQKINAGIKNKGTLTNFESSIWYERAEKYEMAIKFNKNGNKATGEITATLPCVKMVDNSVSFEYSGEVTDMLVTVDAKILENTINAGMKSKGTWTNLESSVWYQRTEKYEMGVKFNKEGSKATGEITATLPCIKMVDNSVSFEYSGDLPDLYLKVDAKIMDHTVNAGLKNKGGWTNGESSIWYERTEKYNLGVAFSKTDEKISGKIEATLPCINVVDNYISFEIDGSLSDFKTTVEANILERKTAVELQFTHVIDLVKVVVKASTPIKGLEDVSATFLHQGEAKKFQQSLNVDVPDKSVAASLKFEPGKSRLEISTPFEKIKSLTVHYGIEGKYTDFNGHVSAELNGKKIAGTTRFRNVNLQYNAGITLTTPFDAVKSLELEWEHNGPLKNCEFTVTVTLNGEKFTMEVNSEIVPADMTAVGKIAITNQIIKPFTFETTWNDAWSWTNMKINEAFTLTIDGTKATFSTDTTMKDFVIDSTTELNNPFIKPVTLNLLVKIKPSWTHVNYDISGSLNGRKFKFSGDLLSGDAKATATMELKTPFERMNAVSVKITHKGTWTDFVDYAEIRVDDKLVAADAQFSMKPEKIDGKFRVSTPFEKVKTVSVTFDHEGSPARLSTDGEISFNSVKLFTMNTVIRPDEKSLIGNYNLRIPALDYDISASLNHKGPLTAFSNDLKISWNEKKISAESRFSKVANDITGYVKVESPWHKAIIAQLKHNGMLSNFVSDLEMQYGSKKFTNGVKYKKIANELEGSVTVTTPYENLKSSELMIKHEGNLASFKTGATLKTDYPPLKDVSVGLDHKGSLSDFTNKVQFVRNGKTYSHTTSMKIIKGWFTVKANSMTPHEILSKGEISVDLKKDDDWNMDMGVTVKATVSGKPVTGMASFNKDSESIKSEIAAKWGYSSKENFLHKISLTRKIQSRRTPIRTYGIEWELASYPLSFVADGNLQSTERSKITDLRVTYNKETATIKNTIEWKTEPERGYTYDLSIRHPRLSNVS